MEKITIENGIKLVAKQVKTFPLGIGQTFDNLINTLPKEGERACYGISWMEGERVIYYAAAEQKGTSELRDFALEPWTIESGEYMAIPITNWREKLDSIKDVFHNLMQDERTDKLKPCVEWYKTDAEMLCMMKTVSN
jgi:hypothetical protein